MAHPNLMKKEKMLDLPGTSLSIWKVHPDVLREQDKNARYMDEKVFSRLVQNIGKENQLESLPYCIKRQSPGGSDELLIISGHHRVRAARKVSLNEIFVLVEEKDLTPDQVRAKQLAHNSLVGRDDEQTLRELYQQIEDINARIEAGIFDLETNIKDVDIKVDDVSFDFNFEQVSILFLKREYERFEEILKEVEDAAHYYVASYEQWDRFAEMIRKVKEVHDVRNIGAILSKIMDIVDNHLTTK